MKIVNIENIVKETLDDSGWVKRENTDKYIIDIEIDGEIIRFDAVRRH